MKLKLGINNESQLKLGSNFGCRKVEDKRIKLCKILKLQC